MQTLRLTETADRGRHQIEIALEGDGLHQAVTASFTFALDQQDGEKLRWYLEQYPETPSNEVITGLAGSIEGRAAELGAELFERVFETTDEARKIWMLVRPRLLETRIEIMTDQDGITALPWELLRDPRTDTVLALRARSFVRSPSRNAEEPRASAPQTAAIRILFVICRPGIIDVPLRSVVSHLVRLSLTTPKALELRVLRPPTFAELQRVLEDASFHGRPYNVVHFDGHGIYADVGQDDKLAAALGIATPLPFAPLLSTRRQGPRGYLLFEDPTVGINLQLVDGPALGSLLTASGVAVLILNACRSAYIDMTGFPSSAAGKEPTPGDNSPAAEEPASDNNSPAAEAPAPNDVPHAYCSLAQEVMDAGLAGVVAMRYNVYVETAAQFIGELYAALAQGQELGAAVTLGRKQLWSRPVRHIGGPKVLRDWNVPVVYEATPLSLVAKPAGPESLIIVRPSPGTTPSRRAIDYGIPALPDAGFVGRDDILFALDRALDGQPIILLQGEDGIGKTATVGEFARWYVRTGGVTEAVLYSSFARHTTLAEELEKLGEAFDLALKAGGTQWASLNQADRREIAIQVLEQKQVLWIWDDISKVADRPEAQSIWKPEEQQELLEFLRAARDTQAKVILTSLDDEQVWLGDLPARISMAAMPNPDRLRLAETIVAKYGQWRGDIKDLREFFDMSVGNPKKLTHMISHVVRAGLATKDQLQAYRAELVPRARNFEG